jgi:hypothetical protein
MTRVRAAGRVAPLEGLYHLRIADRAARPPFPTASSLRLIRRVVRTASSRQLVFLSRRANSCKLVVQTEAHLSRTRLKRRVVTFGNWLTRTRRGVGTAWRDC